MEEIIRSMEKKLNNTIDTEIEKPADCFDRGIVMECCDGLLRLGSTERYILTARQVIANKAAILGIELTGGKKGNSRKTLRVILIAAAIAVLLAVAAVGYAQVKYNILEFSDHSTVSFGFKNDKKVKDLTVGYIPEGFELVEEDRKKEIWGNYYTKGDMFLFISKNAIVSEVSIDTEFNDSKIVKNNGIDYIIYGEEAGGKGIMWVANDYMYIVSTNLTEEEMLKTAFSVS